MYIKAETWLINGTMKNSPQTGPKKSGLVIFLNVFLNEHVFKSIRRSLVGTRRSLESRSLP